MNVDRTARTAGFLFLVGCSSQTAADVEVPEAEIGAGDARSATAQPPRRPRKPRPQSSIPPAPDRSATPEERERAEEAFERGKALSNQGRTREACDAFAESEALAPAIGTEMNLGVCLEQLGDTNSACSALDRARINAAAKQDARGEYIDEYRQKLGCI